MWIKYVKPRKAHRAGPYVKLFGGGVAVRIDVGQTIEVPDKQGHAILADASDIMEVVAGPTKTKAPARSRAKRQTGQAKAAENKQVNAKSYQDAANLAEI